LKTTASAETAIPPLEELRSVAEEGARRSGEILADRFHQRRKIEFKSGIDLVTDADRASEAQLVSWLRSRYPTHSILAEESGAKAGQTLRWLVDPLDGTTNYSHQMPHFSVSVAVEGPNGLLAGAVYDPLRDEMFRAAKGLGAQLNGDRIRPSAIGALEQALLCTGFPYDVRERPEAPLGLFSRFLRKAQGIRRLGSAALDLAYVAMGRFDGFFEFGLKPWDIAAGSLLVREAGGVVLQLDGAALNLAVGDVLACAPGIEEVFVRECTEFLAQMR
jgi:myo-inositol-1(or 4)-monophosphatase